VGLGLKGEVLILKQEEFFPGEELDEIGFKTGKNSFVYKFNEKGNKVYDASLDSLGNIKEISKYQFLSNGNKSSKDIYDIDDNPINSYAYEYDELGRVIKYNIKDFINKIDYYSTAEYDTYGNMLIYSTFTPNGTKVASGEYTYTDGLKVKLVLRDNFDSPSSICIYAYNKFHDVIKEIYYTGNNLPFSEYHIEYKYDAEDNWVEKKYFLAKKYMNSVGDSNEKIGLQMITMRTIITELLTSRS